MGFYLGGDASITPNGFYLHFYQRSRLGLRRHIDADLSRESPHRAAIADICFENESDLFGGGGMAEVVPGNSSDIDYEDLVRAYPELYSENDNSDLGYGVLRDAHIFPTGPPASFYHIEWCRCF